MSLMKFSATVSLLLCLLLAQSAHGNGFERYWLVTCDKHSCESAFQGAVDRRCSGARQCKSVVGELNSACSTCVDELLDAEALESVDGQNYLVCDAEDGLQAAGCRLFCRVNFFSTGQCRRLSNRLPVCQCSDGSDATTEATTTTTTTAAPLFHGMLPQPPAFVASLALLADGRHLASGLYNGQVQIYDLTDGSLGPVYQPHNNTVWTMAVTPTGDLVTGSADNTIKIWSPVDGVVKHTIDYNTTYSLAVLPNGDLASGHSTGFIKIWDLATGKLKMTILAHAKSIMSLAVLAGGQLASSSERTIKIWNPPDFTPLREFSGHAYMVQWLAALPNGQLASASIDKTIIIWDPLEGRLVRTLTGHTNYVQSLAVLPNGDLASSSDDRTVKIWGPNEGSLKRTLEGHEGRVYAVVALPNGDVVSGSYDKEIIVWKL